MKSDKKKAAKDISENGTVHLEQTGQQAQHTAGQQPDWANGLRQLYDSVVEEPLPDSFKDLLSRLDEKS